MKYRGKELIIEINGKSHSEKIEFAIDGIKEGHNISLKKVQEMLDIRSSKGKNYATDRKEKDILHLIQGIEDGITKGNIIKGYFENLDIKSSDYSIFKTIPRPSHIDYAAMKKFGENFDFSGSGEFSGRITVALVACGAICRQILESKGIFIGSHFLSLYNIKDKEFDSVNITKDDFNLLDKNLPLINQDLKEEVYRLVENFRKQKDSFGGVLEIAIVGDVESLGDAYFDRLQANLSSLIMSIPGSKAIEFGNGFKASFKKGSENNDPWTYEDGEIKSKSNNSGGINGGIANGMPIIFRVAFKATSSISKVQKTLNISNYTIEDLEIKGRHDPAFVLRTPVVVESLAAIGILDLLYQEQDKTLREQIDSIDNKLLDLYIDRMNLTDQVGKKKVRLNLGVNDSKREREIIDRLSSKYPDYKREINDFYEGIFHDSKRRQENIIRINNASYGLIGRRLDYSFSKEIHEKMADYDYDLIELRPEELKSFLNKNNLKGLNVTIPYKKSVIKYLDVVTKEAKKIGVVNTIKFEEKKKIGFNTDYYGFKKLLIEKRIFVKNKKAIILGTGATSKTVEAVLRNMGVVDIAFVSRSGPIDYKNIYELKGYEVLVNTTPVGTNDDSSFLLVDLKRLKGLEYVVDVVYNPIYSRLVFEAKKLGIKATGGLDMLFYQAKKTVEIFTDKKISYPEALEIRNQIFDSKLNIVLVGMPGSGKTTIGRNLAKSLNKVHFDLDDEFFKTYGLRPSDVIDKHGEKKFRQMETQICRKIGKNTNLVISTGGGVVTRLENYYYLKQNSIIIYIDRDVRKLSTRNRPISQGGIGSLYKLKDDRIKNYKMFADYTVVNNGHFRRALEEIYNLYREKIREVWENIGWKQDKINAVRGCKFKKIGKISWENFKKINVKLS